ncbi:MAG: gliding motility-associated protein GldM, partial [Psychromonas sp.]
MAGGKESPRQKMINMMYLVLTAMLALQVSNSILQKFLTIDNSLVASNMQSNSSNARTIVAMQEAVENGGNKPEYVALLGVADSVRNATNEINLYIEGLRERIVQEAGEGIDPETNQIKNLAEEEKIANIFLGSANKKDGVGYKLQETLRAFTNKMIGYANNEVTLMDLAPDAKDDPAFDGTKDKGELNKDFAQVMFLATPVPAALASLSQKMSEVRRQEAEVLGNLAS